MTSPTPTILSAKAAADLLGIHYTTLYESAKRGEIPHRRVGKRFIFVREVLVAWATGNADEGASEPAGPAMVDNDIAAEPEAETVTETEDQCLSIGPDDLVTITLTDSGRRGLGSTTSKAVLEALAGRPMPLWEAMRLLGPVCASSYDPMFVAIVRHPA